MTVRAVAVAIASFSLVESASLRAPSVHIPPWACPLTEPETAVAVVLHTVDNSLPKEAGNVKSNATSSTTEAANQPKEMSQKERNARFIKSMGAAADKLAGKRDVMNMHVAGNGAAPTHTEAGLKPDTPLAETVLAVDEKSLTELVFKHEDDLLIAFYAPWCPHCKTFVLDKENGPPIETLSRDLADESGPRVVKFDTTKSNPPAAFKVEFIPTVYMVSKSGLSTKYGQDPGDLKTLKAFAIAHSDKHAHPQR